MSAPIICNNAKSQKVRTTCKAISYITTDRPNLNYCYDFSIIEKHTRSAKKLKK